jgi:hypothetical protein
MAKKRKKMKKMKAQDQQPQAGAQGLPVGGLPYPYDDLFARPVQDLTAQQAL